MELMKDWVRSLFLILLAITFIEMLLPESSMGKYLRFIFSLVIMATILYPVIRLTWRRLMQSICRRLHRCLENQGYRRVSREAAAYSLQKSRGIYRLPAQYILNKEAKLLLEKWKNVFIILLLRSSYVAY